MQLLRTIILIAGVYYLFRIFSRFFASPTSKNQKQQVNNNYQNKTEKKYSKDDGEYVDYEEVN